MTVSSYQVHNVINAYHRHLKVTKPDDDFGSKSKAHWDRPDTVDISSEGRKRQMLEKLGANALSDYHESALEGLRKG